MYKKERNRPFETREEVLAYHKREKIPCLECGKLLIFLPRHIWFVHGMRIFMKGDHSITSIEIG